MNELSRLRGSEGYGARSDDAADTAAELGCGAMPRVSFDPSGWDRGARTLTLPDRRSAGAVRGETVANGLRGYHPWVPANLKAGRVLAVRPILRCVFPWPAAGRTAGCSR